MAPMSGHRPASAPRWRARGQSMLLSGWGRASWSRAEVVLVTSETDAREVLARVADPASADHAAHRGLVARGLGRSYGDAATNGGGLVLDMAGLNRILHLDVTAATVEVQAGVSLDALLRAILPHGLWIPVLPGTRQVSVGGAIGCDIHGKNHHVAGSFGNHVRSLRLLTADGEIRQLSPTGDTSELFWATIGGVGLTGVVLSATLKLERIETSWFMAESMRTGSLAETLEVHEAEFAHGPGAATPRFAYSSAWFDSLSQRPSLGRAAISRGNPARLDELPARLRSRALEPPPASRLRIPDRMPPGLANRFTFGALGQAWFRASPTAEHHVRSLTAFYHPLDLISDWNNAYGPRGFLQYQCVVPPERTDAVVDVIERVQASGHPSFLNVLKVFGPGNDAPLSYPMRGWNLALDFPINVDLGPFCQTLDALVLEAGGRLYTAKDSRTDAATFHAMYPLADRFAQVRARVDPDGLFRSDLARRLEL